MLLLTSQTCNAVLTIEGATEGAAHASARHRFDVKFTKDIGVVATRNMQQLADWPPPCRCVSIQPVLSLQNSSIDIDVICRAVFHLPRDLTFTACTSTPLLAVRLNVWAVVHSHYYRCHGAANEHPSRCICCMRSSDASRRTPFHFAVLHCCAVR